MRILLAGGPRAGKTTLGRKLAEQWGCRLRHTDSIIGKVDHSLFASTIAHWFSAPAPWIIEGCTVPRALRLWLVSHPSPEKPADVVVWMNAQKVIRTPRQESMARGIKTVWRQVEPELRKRGVVIRNEKQVRQLDTRRIGNAQRLESVPVPLLTEGQPTGPGGPPPVEFIIWKFGQVHTKKGSFVFDQEACDAVMADWREWNNRLTFDYGHDATSPMAEGTSGISAGSCLLEARADGLWAVDVRWTLTAAEQLKKGEWLYFSPAFLDDPDSGRIVSLVNIALTNIPATNGMTPLVAASAVPFDGLPMVRAGWDAASALGRVRKWASTDGTGDVTALDWSKYKLAFAWVDPANAENIGGYKLPHHDVRDGKLVAISDGVGAATAALQGARGGVAIPDEDVAAVKSHIAAHLAQLDVQPPWKTGPKRTSQMAADELKKTDETDHSESSDGGGDDDDAELSQAKSDLDEATAKRKKLGAKHASAELEHKKAKLEEEAAKKTYVSLGGHVSEDGAESSDGASDGGADVDAPADDAGAPAVLDAADDEDDADDDDDSMPPPPKDRPNTPPKEKAMSRIAQAARQLTGRQTSKEIVAALQAMSATKDVKPAGDQALVRVQALEGELRKRDVTDRITLASAAGKMTPKLAPQAEKIGMRDGIKALDAFIDALPVMVKTRATAHVADTTATESVLEPWEDEMCKRMGNDPVKYLAQKKANAEKVAQMKRGG